MNKALHRVRIELSMIARWRSHRRLAKIKRGQKAAFDELKGRFVRHYLALKQHGTGDFATALWQCFNAKLEKVFLPQPPFSFLKDATIGLTMFVTMGGKWLEAEVAFLETQVPKEMLSRLLLEDYVGDPLLLHSEYLTSHNSIHHLYHVVRFQERTGCRLDEIRSVVEWGGGYGSLARIFRRLSNGQPTYVIIDTPLLSCIQWLYLTSILGEESVHLLQNSEDTIHSGKINLVPLCFLDGKSLSANLFISTWGLSESSRYAQDYVAAHRWLKFKHVLLAYQDSSQELPDADRVGRMAAEAGAVVEDISFLPGNHYAFR